MDKKLFIIMYLIAGLVAACNVNIVSNEALTLSYWTLEDNGYGGSCDLFANDSASWLYCCQGEDGILENESTLLRSKNSLTSLPPFFSITVNASLAAFDHYSEYEGGTIGIKESGNVISGYPNDLLTITQWASSSANKQIKLICDGAAYELHNYGSGDPTVYNMYEIKRSSGSNSIDVYFNGVLKHQCTYSSTNKSLQFFMGLFAAADQATADGTQCTRMPEIDITGNYTLEANYKVQDASGIGINNCTVSLDSIIYADSNELWPSSRNTAISGYTSGFEHDVGCIGDAFGAGTGFSWIGRMGATCPNGDTGSSLVILNNALEGSTYNITVGVEGEFQQTVYVRNQSNYYISIAEVYATGANGVLYSATLASEGEYVFTGLPQQTYSMTVAAPGYETQDDIEFIPVEGDDIIYILLERPNSPKTFTVTVNVTDYGDIDTTYGRSIVYTCPSESLCSSTGVSSCDYKASNYHDSSGDVYFPSMSTSDAVVCIQHLWSGYDHANIERYNYRPIISDHDFVFTFSYGEGSNREYCFRYFDNINMSLVSGITHNIYYDNNLIFSGTESGTQKCVNLTYNGGLLYVEANKVGYDQGRATINVIDGKQNYDLIFVRLEGSILPSETYSVSGYVLSGNSKLLNVPVRTSCKVETVVTDESTGLYTFSNLTYLDNCDFFCTAANYDSSHEWLTITSNAENFNISVDPRTSQTHYVTFQAYSDDGVLPGVLVDLGTKRCTTDSLGNCVIPDLTYGKTYPITATKTGYEPYYQSFKMDSIYVTIHMTKDEDVLGKCEIRGDVKYINGTTNQIGLNINDGYVNLYDRSDNLLLTYKVKGDGYSYAVECNRGYRLKGIYGDASQIIDLKVEGGEGTVLNYDFLFLSDEATFQKQVKMLMDFAKMIFIPGMFLVILFLALIVMNKLQDEARGRPRSSGRRYYTRRMYYE